MPIAVLTRRNLESYLFDDEVLAALCAKDGHPELTDEVLAAKRAEMSKATEERRRPSDDVKASAGPIKDVLRRKLNLTQCGNTPKEFMRVTLAPLVGPDMAVYNELKEAVFPASA